MLDNTDYKRVVDEGGAKFANFKQILHVRCWFAVSTPYSLFAATQRMLQPVRMTAA